jgi:hypothetical protein
MKVVKVRHLTPRSNRKVKRKVVNDDPWLEGWMYRKSHVINPASGAGTNYQVRIVAHYGSGTDSGADVYLNGKCRTDFGDVRFTRSDGVTLLDYWMQEKVDGDNAVFWVEVADDLSTNPVTIYIYYGNSSATTTSNINNTFIFGDDFRQDSSIDTSKWSESGSATKTFSSTDGLKVDSTSLWSIRTVSTFDFSNKLRVIAKMRWAVAVSYCCALYICPTSTTSDPYNESNWVRHTHEKSGSAIRGQEKVSGTITVLWSVSFDTNWHYNDIRTNGGNYLACYLDNVQKYYSTSAGLSFVNNYVYLNHSASGSATSYFMYCFITKFTDPEPSHGSWGSEETAVIERAVNVSNESVSPTSGFEGDGVTYQATVLDSAGEPLPSSFVADLVMDSIVLVNDKAFTSDVYNPSNGLLTLQFTVPNVLGTRTVRLEALLTDNAGNPLEGKTLTFKHKFSSESSWTTDGTQVTGSDGKASLTIDVETHKYYDFRVEFAGDDVYEASYDEELNVYIAPKTSYTVKLVWLEQTI